LIVDDEPGVRKVLKWALEHEGYQRIEEAEDGDEAVALSRTERLDLIVMDNQMKRLCGRQAISRIKEKNPDVKIIIMTGMPMPSLVRDCMSAGAANFIIKPIGIPHFLTLIKNQMIQPEQIPA
jgi:CheY-like chemotaxis protein